ncbi:uncharacterized protein LOC114121449 [Aphis gossypii]|uniref:Uncharacterized protein n=1 Tax=Aphis gossypii TaxID=80765 RepID=A0A9P0JAS0_APHGO|nr:uncharacterized protein LOC114121449 [Aphis gossypii]XP_027839598.2 uncharacterized protein LOC114121449 [Aphis gossypii]XP_050063560.1 uncharacterized protein LOC114121449 [Aphis gossypii]CAH1732280.1 unnamed protein product [Aphis gossypii]
MNPNNHQKTLKIIEQLLMCTPYVFVKRLTEEDIHVMTTKDSIKTEHMKKCLDSDVMTNNKMEKESFRKPTVSSSNISGNEKFQKSNQTNVNLKKKSLANSTAPCLSSSSSKIIQKPKLNNIKMETETSYSHTISSSSSLGFQRAKKSIKRKLSNEQSYSHTISSSSSTGFQTAKKSKKRKLSNEQPYTHTISSTPSSGIQSSKQSMQRKLSNVKLKNESSTCLQFNGPFKNISKDRLSSEDLSGKIQLRHPKDILKPSLYDMYKINFQKYRITKCSIKNRTAMLNSNDKIDLQLYDFTLLFDKYFGIPLQKTIVIIANIANASLLLENFYSEKKALFRMKIFNFELLQDHKIVLVSTLQNCLVSILFSIDEYDVYNMALILFMCMLSIIPSLRDLDWNDTFKDLVQLFCKNLEQSQPRFLKFINCIESHTFQSDCNYLIKLFDVAARLDCTMRSRMKIFFKPKNKLIDYFKRVNRAVRRNSNDKGFFERLVHESLRNLCESYKFKESQGIFLKNNAPTISENTTNDENKKPAYLRRSNKNTTSKNTTNANLETSLENSASNITNV